MRKYVELTKRQLDEMNRNDIILVSVVSPIEIHGPHLPLGTDLFIAREVMERTTSAMTEYEFLELPELSTGAQPLPVNGSVGVRYRTLYRLLVEWGKQLKKAGFSKWVIFDNHGGPSHMLAEADASRRLKRLGFELIVPFIGIMNGMNEHDSEIGLGHERDGSLLDAHAGTNETSLYMAVNDSFKDKDYGKYAPRKTFPGRLIRLLGSDGLGFNIDWISDDNHPSYIGEPAKADRESGERMLAYHVMKSVRAVEGDYSLETGYNMIVRILLRLIG
jgi:creatinine amidohydrolase/Fe(II)-dependent formamide hydrolase-like protein